MKRCSLVCWCRDVLFLSLNSDVSNLVFYEQSTVTVSSCDGCYCSIHTLMRTWSKSGGCGLQKEDWEGKEKHCENDWKRLPESGPMWGVCDLNCEHQLAAWTILDSLCACLITKETNLRVHPSCNPGVPYHRLMWLQCCLTLMPNSSWTVNRNLSQGFSELSRTLCSLQEYFVYKYVLLPATAPITTAL